MFLPRLARLTGAPGVVRPLVATFSSTEAPQNALGTRKSVDHVAQELLSAPNSKIPTKLSRIAAALKVRFAKDPIDPTLKSLLDSASAQLYYECANNFDYDKLCSSFGLPDYMSSWFKLTLIHTWMVLMRLHVSLDGNAYLRLQRGLLATMWTDVDSRLQIVGQELNQILHAKSDMEHMHGLHLQTFLEYDEGFLRDDRVLAGAVWRCLYMQRECDPIHVLKVVTYMRATMAWLDTLDVDHILVEGVKEWRQVKPRA